MRKHLFVSSESVSENHSDLGLPTPCTWRNLLSLPLLLVLTQLIFLSRWAGWGLAKLLRGSIRLWSSTPPQGGAAHVSTLLSPSLRGSPRSHPSGSSFRSALKKKGGFLEACPVSSPQNRSHKTLFLGWVWWCGERENPQDGRRDGTSLHGTTWRERESSNKEERKEQRWKRGEPNSRSNVSERNRWMGREWLHLKHPTAFPYSKARFSQLTVFATLLWGKREKTLFLFSPKCLP